MYKSKLQELCQSKAWDLPKYSTNKEGLDHCPQFKATVIVQGSTFSTPDFCKSSKQAHNLAAKLAFDHLTGSLSASSSSPVRPACNDAQQTKTNETVCVASLSGLNSPNRGDKKFRDVSHLYKNQLQTYAQKRNVLLPMYFFEHEGPPHARRFKSKVTLDGKTYESPEYFSTIKDAENAAAKVALMAVSSDGVKEEDPSFYENLLLELAQVKYSCLPAYNTTSFGTSPPNFISTVEIRDRSFIGREAKTKKLAEMDVAKIAYISLKDYLQKQNSVPYSPGSHVEDSPHCSSPKEQSIAMAELSQQIIPGSALRSSETSTEQARGAYQKRESEPIVVESKVIAVTGGDACKPNSPNSPSASVSKVIAVTGGDACKPNSPNSPSACVQYPSTSGIQANTEQPAGTGSFPSYKKVKIYPRTPDMTFPPGTTIMYNDEKWVAVTNSDSIQDNA